MIKSGSFHYNDLLSLLEDSIKSAENEVLLVAPFIKHPIIETLLLNLKEETKLTVYTRWRLDEILSGVSDIEIWELIRKRDNSYLKLSPNLHAKYYRFDDLIILGSANLTAKALVRNPASYFELLQTSELTNESHSFEIALVNQSIEVNDELFERVKGIVDQYEERELPTAVNELGINYKADVHPTLGQLDLKQWLPKSRNPENLFFYYSNMHVSLTDDQIKHAEIDLTFFPIPRGMNKKMFNESVSFYMLQMPIVQKIDAFLTQSRRFGEMTDFLENEFNLKEREMATKRTWQTLMRWLKFYLKDEYEITTANYSEIVRKFV